MANKGQPQGRVLRLTAEHPSSVRTVAGTSTHVDATKKMMTGPSVDMAFLDNYLCSLSSDLNTPEIDHKLFDFGKENAKSKLTVSGMEMSKMTTPEKPFPECAAFFDMSISSPPSFLDEDTASSQNYKIAEPSHSRDLNSNMVPTVHTEEHMPQAPLLANSQPFSFNSVMATEHTEEPIPKAPLLCSTPSLGFNSVSHRNNPVTQPSEMPFDLPNIFDDNELFPDAYLDDSMTNTKEFDTFFGQVSESEFLCMELESENDILSQAIAGAELPSPEQLNNLLETTGMMQPTKAQLKSTHMIPPPVSTSTAQTAPQHVSQGSNSNSAPHEIAIPNLFLNTSEYQAITYQVQEFTQSPSQQVQNNVIDSVQLMEVNAIPTNTMGSTCSVRADFPVLPSCNNSIPTVELSDELEIKPVVDYFDESLPSTSTGKRKRAVKKPARFRDSLMDYPYNESQPSTSDSGQKKLKLTDEEKYNRIRIMNNEASRKCRQKRKENLVNMEQEIVDLEKKKQMLTTKEAELTRIRDRMKTIYYEFMKRQMAPR